jgi:hypothetical protein
MAGWPHLDAGLQLRAPCLRRRRGQGSSPISNRPSGKESMGKDALGSAPFASKGAGFVPLIRIARSKSAEPASNLPPFSTLSTADSNHASVYILTYSTLFANLWRDPRYDTRRSSVECGKSRRSLGECGSSPRALCDALPEVRPVIFQRLAHSCALFKNLNFLIFMRFRTLCKKHPGWGYNPHPQRAKVPAQARAGKARCGQFGGAAVISKSERARSVQKVRCSC